MGGGVPTLFRDFFTRADGAPGNGWYSPDGGTIAIASNALAITPTLGEELLLNGGFDTAANWSIGISASWSIGSGVASYDDVTTSYLQQTDISIVSGEWLQFRFDVNAPALIRLAFYGNSGSIDNAFIPYAAYNTNSYFRAVGAIPNANQLRIYADNGEGDGEIDNVSLKKMSALFALRAQAFTNAYAQAAITRTAYTQAGIAHYADADNFVIAYFNGDDKVKLVKNVAGTYTEVGSADITYGAGNVLKLSRSGTTYTVTYDDVDELTQTISDSAFTSAKTWGLFSTHNGNSFDDYEWGKN
jgi:hypothetical protein